METDARAAARPAANVRYLLICAVTFLTFLSVSATVYLPVLLVEHRFTAAPLDDLLRRGQGEGGSLEGLRAHAFTPTPMGQATPVPPTPQ